MEDSKQLFISPAACLSELIDHYWFASVFGTAQSEHYQVHIPLGCIDMYGYYQGSKHQRIKDENSIDIPSLFFIGSRNIDKRVTFANFSIPFKGFRVRFTTSGFYKIFGIPASELYNEVYAVEEVLGNIIKTLQEKIELSKNENEIRIILDQFFCRCLLLNNFKNCRTSLPSCALDLIHKSHGTIRVNLISEKLGISERSLVDKFRIITGLSPKEYCKNTQIFNIIRKISFNKIINWTELALENGYYDQAHFVNEFKKATSVTPEHFQRNINKSIVFGNGILVFRYSNSLDQIYQEMIDAEHNFKKTNT